MLKEAKNSTNTSVSMDDLTEALQNALKQGKGEGRTIKLMNKEEIKTNDLFKSPTEIKNGNIKSLLDATDPDATRRLCWRPYYFYAPDVSTDTDQAALAEKLYQECEITDYYKDLHGRQDNMIKGIVEDLKPFCLKVYDWLQKLQDGQADILDGQTEIKNVVGKEFQMLRDHKTCSVVLLGDTGVGKSSIACYLANTFRKDHFKVSHTTKITTNNVDFLETKVFPGTDFENEFNTTLKISDCPGLGRTAKHDGKVVEDPEILKEVADHIATYGGEVAAFLLVLNCEKEMQAKRLQKYAEKFDTEGGAFFNSLIAIFNKTDIEEENDIEEFCKAFDPFIEKTYKDPDTRETKKDQVKAVPVIHFDDNIEIDHDSADKPFSHDWAKGYNLEQAKELIYLIREKSNDPYRSPKTAQK